MHEYVASLPKCPMTGLDYDRYVHADGSAATAYGIKCTVGSNPFPIYGMYESEDRTWVYNDDGVVY